MVVEIHMANVHESHPIQNRRRCTNDSISDLPVHKVRLAGSREQLHGSV